MNRKGFAIMFDWIFSLAAGVLIFSFLIYFAVQHTDLFGKVTARVVGEELDILFSGYETTQTKSMLDFGKDVKLGFSCDEKNKRQRFTINDREGKTLWGKIIFAPGEIKNDKINVATASWDVPFRAANFIYLWDKKYVLTGDIPDINFLNNFKKEDIGNTANIRFVDDPSLSDDYGTGECPNDFGFQHEKIIYYDEDSSGDFSGYVCFEDDDRERHRSFFYGEAMMIGAIFMDNVEDFECVKSIAVDRLKIVNDIYREKKDKIVSLESCDKFGRYNKVFHDTITLDKLNSLDFDNQVKLVERANENLIREGCAGVY